MGNEGNNLGLCSGSIVIAVINGKQHVVQAIDVNSDGDGWFDQIIDREIEGLRMDGFIEAKDIVRLVKR